MILLRLYLIALGKLCRGIVEDGMVIVGLRSRGSMHKTWTRKWM